MGSSGINREVSDSKDQPKDATADQSGSDAGEFKENIGGNPDCPRCNGELATVPADLPYSEQHIKCMECDSTFPEKANLGDTIECDISTVMPDGVQKLQAILETEDALAYGNLLVASGRWKVVE